MSKLLRMTTLAATAAAVALTTPAAAAPTGATPQATARANIIKPLTLTRIANLDFGDIVVQDTGTATIGVDGAITCSAGLTCAATGTAAGYTVTGTNRQVVTVTKPDVVLTNSVDGTSTLTLDLIGPDTVTLSNSGAEGVDFYLGGSMVIDAAAAEGEYVGNLQVTVDYQ